MGDMHFGNYISDTMLALNDRKFNFIIGENDLGLIIDYNLNFSSHVVTQVRKANKMVGSVRCSYTYLDRKTFCCLSNFLIRSLLEYCISIWYSHLKKDKDIIENKLHWTVKSSSGF